MSNSVIFLISMVSGTLLIAFEDIFLKKNLTAGLPERLMLVLNWGGAGVLFALILPLFGLPEIKSGFWSALSITLLLNIIGQYFWYRAFNLSQVSLIAPMRLLIPVFVLGTGFLILGEVPTQGGFIGLIITIMGLFLLMLSEEADLRQTIFSDSGIRFAYLSVLCFAVSFPFDKKAVVLSSPIFFATLMFLSVGLIQLIIFLSRDQFKNYYRLLHFQRKSLFYNIFFKATGGFLTIFSLQFALVSYASSIKRLQSLWTVILSGRFLGEKNIGRRVLATVVMLLGVATTVIFG